MIIRAVLIAAALTLVFSGPAFAGKNSSSGAKLLASGNTIAGPGSNRASLDETDVLADGVEEDICVTVAASSGKASTALRIDLIDVEAVESSMALNSGETAALCQNDTETVQVVCLGPTSCSYSWRVDRK